MTPENAVLNHVKDHLGLKNDAALCRKMDVAPPVISLIRKGGLGIGAVNLLRLHVISGISIMSLMDVLGVPDYLDGIDVSASRGQI